MNSEFELAVTVWMNSSILHVFLEAIFEFAIDNIHDLQLEP